MEIDSPLCTFIQTVVTRSRDLLQDASFCERHRTCKKHFTRQRHLTFANVMLFILGKSVRSLQNRLHDFFKALGSLEQSVTISAWCQSRMKLCHTAFIELNQHAILDVIYSPDSGFAVRRWRGHRLLGIDSSLLRLPAAEAVGQEFGWVACANEQGACGRYAQARLSVLTDVLNRIAIHTRLVAFAEGERGLAAEHLLAMAADDIAILDRGYASYELLAQFVKHQRLFVCRCPRSSFRVVNELFRDDIAGRTLTCQVSAHHAHRAAVSQKGLPLTLTLRFVTVRLSTGELEVLATLLLDENRYPTAEFAVLYNYRWGIETFYALVKGRLDLERFSGVSPEAIRQDVFATLFLSNLESVLIQPALLQLQIHSKSRVHRQQVNHSVSFHAIKCQLLDLLLSRRPLDEVLQTLQCLFLDNPVVVRPERKVTRRKQSPWRSFHFQRNTKKHVF